MKTSKHFSSLGLDSFLSCNALQGEISLSSCIAAAIDYVIIKPLACSSIVQESRSQTGLSYREVSSYHKNSTLYILGIDPGLSGAIALISFNRLSGAVNFEQVIDIPTKDGKSFEVIEFSKIVKSLIQDKNLDEIVCCIERVGEMPTKSDPLRSFKFGFTTGAIHAVLFLLGLKVTAVKPHIWKACLGLGSDKTESLNKAMKLFPASAPYLSRKKDHDRAEAILLAYFLTSMLKTFKPENH